MLEQNPSLLSLVKSKAKEFEPWYKELFENPSSDFLKIKGKREEALAKAEEIARQNNIATDKLEEIKKIIEFCYFLQNQGIANYAVFIELEGMNFGLRLQQILGEYYKEKGEYAQANKYYEAIRDRYLNCPPVEGSAKAKQLQADYGLAVIKEEKASGNYPKTIGAEQAKQLYLAYAGAITALADIQVAKGEYAAAIKDMQGYVGAAEEYGDNVYQTKVYFDFVCKLMDVYKEVGDYDSIKTYLSLVENEIKNRGNRTAGEKVPLYEQYMWDELFDRTSIFKGWLNLEKKEYALAEAEFSKVKEKYEAKIEKISKKETLTIYKDVLNRQTQAYLDAVKGLANVYLSDGSYAQAEQACKDVRAWIKGQGKVVLTDSAFNVFERYQAELGLLDARLAFQRKKYQEAKDTYESIIKKHCAKADTIELSFNSKNSLVENRLVVDAWAGLAGLAQKQGIASTSDAKYGELIVLAVENEGVKKYLDTKKLNWNLARGELAYLKQDYVTADEYFKKVVKDFQALPGAYRLMNQVQANYQAYINRANITKEYGFFKNYQTYEEELTDELTKATFARDKALAEELQPRVKINRGWMHFTKGEYLAAQKKYLEVINEISTNKIEKLSDLDKVEIIVDTKDGWVKENLLVDALNGLAVLNTYWGRYAWAEKCLAVLHDIKQIQVDPKQVEAGTAKAECAKEGITIFIGEKKEDAKLGSLDLEFEKEQYVKVMQAKDNNYPEFIKKYLNKTSDLREQLLFAEAINKIAQVYLQKEDATIALGWFDVLAKYIKESPAQEILQAKYQWIIKQGKIAAYVQERRNKNLYRRGEAEPVLIGAKQEIKNTLELLTKKNNEFLLKVNLISSDKSLEDIIKTGLETDADKDNFEQACLGLTLEEKKLIINLQMIRGDIYANYARQFPATQMEKKAKEFENALKEYYAALYLADYVSDIEQSMEIEKNVEGQIIKEVENKRCGAPDFSFIIIRKIAQTYGDLNKNNVAFGLYAEVYSPIFKGRNILLGASEFANKGDIKDWQKAQQKAKEVYAFINEKQAVETEEDLDKFIIKDKEVNALHLEFAGIYSHTWKIIEKKYLTKSFRETAEEALYVLEKSFNILPSNPTNIIARAEEVSKKIENINILDKKVKQAIFMLGMAFVYDRYKENNKVATKLLNKLKEVLEGEKNVLKGKELFSKEAWAYVESAYKKPTLVDAEFVANVDFTLGALEALNGNYIKAELIYNNIIDDIKSKISAIKDSPEDIPRKRIYEGILIRARLEIARVYFMDKKYDLAINYYEDLLGLKKEKKLREFARKLGKMLFNIDRKKKDYKAEISKVWAEIKGSEEKIKDVIEEYKSEIEQSYMKEAWLDFSASTALAVIFLQEWNFIKAENINAALNSLSDELNFNLVERNKAKLAVAKVLLLQNSTDIDRAEKICLSIMEDLGNKKLAKDLASFELLKNNLKEDATKKADYEKQIAIIKDLQSKLAVQIDAKKPEIKTMEKIFIYNEDLLSSTENIEAEDTFVNLVTDVFFTWADILRNDYPKRTKAAEEWYKLVQGINPHHLGAQEAIKTKVSGVGIKASTDFNGVELSGAYAVNKVLEVRGGFIFERTALDDSTLQNIEGTIGLDGNVGVIGKTWLNVGVSLNSPSWKEEVKNQDARTLRARELEAYFTVYGIPFPPINENWYRLYAGFNVKYFWAHENSISESYIKNYLAQDDKSSVKGLSTSFFVGMRLLPVLFVHYENVYEQQNSYYPMERLQPQSAPMRAYIDHSVILKTDIRRAYFSLDLFFKYTFKTNRPKTYTGSILKEAEIYPYLLSLGGRFNLTPFQDKTFSLFVGGEYHTLYQYFTLGFEKKTK
ncbi:MAG: hypothetical protein KKA19_01385 [Candidatus Margulisbacteria bacterium]|nr:hypothetical protein [Candidatus Margulisiibacteriota bacterium]